MKKIFILFLMTALASSCVVKKQLKIVDGSKADGTLTMAYEIRRGQKAKYNIELAKAQALERCKQWGYKDVDVFDTGIRECIQYSQGNCIKFIVRYKCQCVD